MPILIADTAWVDPRARIEEGVEIGPFCIVGPEVTIGSHTCLSGHVYVQGPVALGRRNRVSPFTALGGDFLGTDPRARQGRLEIGDENQIRESVVIECGRSPSETTRIACKTIIQPGVHIAAGCQIADQVALGDHAILSASVQIQSRAIVGSAVTIHGDVNIGEMALVAAQSRIIHDVPPFLIVDGQPARVRCIHVVGLKKLGLDRKAIEALHEAHRLLFRARMDPAQALQVLTAHGQRSSEVERLVAFVQDQQAGSHGRARAHAQDTALATVSSKFRKSLRPPSEAC